MTQVRTRFAPSPTGLVHIGNMRAAIFNWLYSRHTGGKFLLRIEDTDRERSTPEAIQAVLDAMIWLGLDYDEPALYQSQQFDAHRAAAETLLSKGFAYKEDKGGTGKGEAIVFRMPGRDMVFHDLIKGDLRKPAANLPNFVIVRSDGTPVFHLANVLDDIKMGITHVIRGDDHIENTYRHVALYEALGAPVPSFAHLPMIVNAQGKPYSKRDGAAFIGEFREKGFDPQALFNYLALLGWSPGDDREIVSREEMIRLFDIAKVKSAPAQMNFQKLEWMNSEYLRQMPTAAYEKGCSEALKAKGLLSEAISPDYASQVFALMRERIKLFNDLPEIASFFFTEDYPYDEKAVRQRIQKPEALTALKEIQEVYSHVSPFTAQNLETGLRELATQKGVNAGHYIHPVRVAVSGLSMGPSLFEMLALLGPTRVLPRLTKTLERFA